MPDTSAVRLRRILSVIPEIGDGREHNIDEVAAHAGVTRETILADLQALADRLNDPAGFSDGMQIFIEQDSIGVTYDHFLRPMGLTLPELGSLELGLAILRAERPPDETALIEKTRESLRKLIAKLPADHDEASFRHVELAPTGGLPFLDELRKALRDRRKARIVYRRGGSDEPTTRIVRLYAMVPASGTWYAVAYCESAGDLRVFRMDRVEDATVLADKYEIPSDFSVADTLRQGKGLKSELPTAGIRVRYSPRIARWIAEREGKEPDADGSLTMEHPLADDDWGIRHVLQYGPDAKVIEPQSLRDEILRRLSAING